MPKLDPPIGT